MIFRLFVIFSLFLSLTPRLLWGQLFPVINEVSNFNFKSVLDEYGEAPSWAELYNPHDTILSLQGLFLSNNATIPQLYSLPDTTLEAHQHILVLFSGRSYVSRDFIHANFEWTGSSLFLSTSNGIFDQVTVPALSVDCSYGRSYDAANTYMIFGLPTPGAPNDSTFPYVPITDQLSVWPFSGWYPVDSLRLEINATDPTLEIRVGMNGFLPEDSTGITYQSQFWLQPHNSEMFSFIPTTTTTIESRFRWRTPASVPSHVNVISVAGFRDGKRVTPYYHRHYFLQRESPTLDVPVISIQTSPDNLFGFEKGIYVPGITHAQTPVTSWPWGTGNFHQRGRAWEHPAHLSFFEPDGSLAFEQNLGIRIHGGGSRALALKSLRLYSRSVYGTSRLRYPFFPERDFANYNRILLRNSGQDFLRTMFNDAMVANMVAPLDLDVQLSRPIIHYINGEYWGILNIRDRVDEHFISYTRGVAEEDVELITIDFAKQETDSNSWPTFISQVRDYSDYSGSDFFEFLQEKIDVQNLIDYLISRVYISSVDWPGNNRSVWRHASDTGRFRNIFFDNDNTLDLREANTLKMALAEDGSAWPNPAWSTLLFRKSLLNETFRELFIRRNEELVNTVFEKKRMIGILDSFVELYEPLMLDHIYRWQFPGNTISAWYFHVKNMRRFIEERPCVIREIFRDYFDLPENYLSNLQCESNGFAPILDDEDIVVDIFPNPTQGAVSVAAEVQPYSEIRLSIFDVQGRKLFDEKIIEESRFFVRDITETSNWMPGVYLVRFENLDKVIVRRLIVN